MDPTKVLIIGSEELGMRLAEKLRGTEHSVEVIDSVEEEEEKLIPTVCPLHAKSVMMEAATRLAQVGEVVSPKNLQKCKGTGRHKNRYGR